MRHFLPALATLTMAATTVGPAAAQTPAQTSGAVRTPPPLVARARPFSAGDVVNRILSFDADDDQRVTRDELPERMQGLVERGDRDGDGVLTAQEVETLVVGQTSDDLRTRRISGQTKPFGLADVVSDLKLPQPKHDLAMALVKAHSVPRNVNDPASIDRDTLHARMRELLDDEEYEDFVAAAARISAGRVGAIVRGIVTVRQTSR